MALPAMPTCYVPGCKSGYGGKPDKHFFSPPQDEHEFLKWVKAIARTDFPLTRKCRVCHVHFSDDSIIKSDEFIIEGERVIIQRAKWKLRPGAIPQIFPTLPKSKPSKARKLPARKCKKIPDKRRKIRVKRRKIPVKRRKIPGKRSFLECYLQGM